MEDSANILLLAGLMVYIVDLSGFADTIKDALGKWLKCKVTRLKPFDCSLCMTWWSGLIYLLVVGRFTLPMIAVVAGASFLTPVIGNILMAVRDMLLWLTNKIINLFN